jgi:hypothetical protein
VRGWEREVGIAEVDTRGIEGTGERVEMGAGCVRIGGRGLRNLGEGGGEGRQTR